MKKILIYLFLFLLFSCKSQNIDKEDKARFYLNKTIEIFEEKKHKIDSENDFILLSSMNFNNTILKDAKYCIGISIMSSNLTNGLKYKKTFRYKNITVISKDTLSIFKTSLLPVPFKNVNKNNKEGVTYDPFTITLFLDKRGKIVYVSPDDYENYYKIIF
jgi:hypothetical protein